MLVGAVLAVLFGLLSVTANPVFISVAVALFVGVFLIARPAWTVWLVLTLGLLVAGILPLLSEDGLVTKTTWGVSILAFTLMMIAFFMAVTSSATRRNTPAFVWVALGFLVYSVIVSFIQWYSMGEFSGGFKRYFQMWGLLFALCWLPFDERDIRRWRVFLLIVALIQLPFAAYELIALVPMREGLRNIVPIDVVAGTFGAMLYGGGASGEMAAFLIMVLAFLLTQRMEKILTTRRLMLLIPLILSPLFLGETKAVVILLPVMFLVLYRRVIITRPHYGLAGLLLGGLLTAGSAYFYLSLSEKNVEGQIKDYLDYNVYDKGYGTHYLNRTTVLTFWAQQQGAHNPVSLVLGNGLGSSHTQAGGHVAMRYPNHGIGLTTASSLLWDVGMFGFGLFAAIFVLAWRTAGQLQQKLVDPIIRADAAAIQAALALFAVYLFFRSSLLETMSFQIIFVVLLGYLARLHRRHAVSDDRRR
jgi:hypothetical protein